MHKIGCDIGCHLHDLTYLMMQLKASSPNLMVHQQCSVQLFLCARYTTKLQTTCLHAHKIYEIYTRLNDEQQKQRSYLGRGVSKVGGRAKPFGNPGMLEMNEFSPIVLPPQNLTNPKPS